MIKYQFLLFFQNGLPLSWRIWGRMGGPMGPIMGAYGARPCRPWGAPWGLWGANILAWQDVWSQFAYPTSWLILQSMLCEGGVVAGNGKNFAQLPPHRLTHATAHARHGPHGPHGALW